AAQERVHVGEDLLDRVAERDAIEALLAQESRDGVLAGPLAAGEPDQDGAHGSGSPTGSGSEVRGRRVGRDGHVVAVQAVEVARGVDLGADVVRLRRAEEVELLAAALGLVAVLADESGGLVQFACAHGLPVGGAGSPQCGRSVLRIGERSAGAVGRPVGAALLAPQVSIGVEIDLPAVLTDGAVGDDLPLDGDVQRVAGGVLALMVGEHQLQRDALREPDVDRGGAPEALRADGSPRALAGGGRGLGDLPVGQVDALHDSSPPEGRAKTGTRCSVARRRIVAACGTFPTSQASGMTMTKESAEPGPMRSATSIVSARLASRRSTISRPARASWASARSANSGEDCCARSFSVSAGSSRSGYSARSASKRGLWEGRII